MNKLLAMVVCLGLLSGCNETNNVGVSSSGDVSFLRICIDNVEYLIRRNGNNGYMAPHFKPDGSLYTCN